MIRTAVLGCGRIGRIHAANLARHPQAQLVCVSDPDEAAAAAVAAETGAALRPLHEAVVAPEVDALVIATPTDTHADLIARAARAGKAVFCEKPIDIFADRVRSCLAEVEAAGVPLMVGFNRRFDPSFAALKRRLEAGEIGAPELVTILSRDPAPPPLDYLRRSGGLFRDMTIHDLDMARFLLGEEPVEVQAAASVLVDPAIADIGDVDTAVVTLRTESGRLCQISNSRRAGYGYDQRIEVQGAKGMLQAGNLHRTTVTAATAEGFLNDPLQDFFLERYAEAYRVELQAFVDALVAGRPPSPSGEDGLKALLLADAATEACSSRETVRPARAASVHSDADKLL